jgi:putative transposase
LGLFSINRICKLCGIAKITFQNYEHPDDRFEAKYSHIKTKVESIIKEHSAYGIKRIKVALFDKYQIHIGRDALARLLRLWGLQLKRKIRKKKVSIIKKILISLADRTNLLIRSTITQPFQAITGDISEIFYDHGRKKAYLSVHKDVFGQMVYGHKLGQTMETKLIRSSFKQAKKSIQKLIKCIPTKMLCHQDQGSQYTSYGFVDDVLKSNMRLSYSTPGTPTENPGQESFFGRFKDENRDEIDEIRDFKELDRFIRKRINYYNLKRIHTSTRYKTPLKFTQTYINNLSLTEAKKWFSISRD